MGSELVVTAEAEAVHPLPPPSDPGGSEFGRKRSNRGRWIAAMLLAGALGVWAGSATLRQSTPQPQEVGPDPGTLVGAPIAGFEDVLLAVVTDGSRPLSHVMWPPSGDLEELALPASWSAVTFESGPFGQFAEFDASARQVALGAPVAGEERLALLAGRAEAVVVVATDVTSYAWHSTEPRRLAYVVEEGSDRFLDVMSGAPRATSRIEQIADGIELVAWTDTGFIFSSEAGVTLGFGDEAQPLPGTVLDGRGQRLGLVSDGLVVIHDLETGASTETAVAGTAARFDLRAERLAVAGPDAVVIVDAETGAALHRYDLPLVGALAWSTDGEFLVVADRVDVRVIDIATGEITSLGLGPAVAVATRPVSSP